MTMQKAMSFMKKGATGSIKQLKNGISQVLK
jgi:hypothetical protein